MILSPLTPISNIPRISLAYQKRLIKLGVKTLRDLFYHFPHRYDDFSQIKSIGELKENEVVTIQGKVTKIKNVHIWKRKMNITEIYVEDETGGIKATWFNQPYIANSLPEGTWVSLSGKVNPTKPTKVGAKLLSGTNINKGLYLSNPSYEKINKDEPLALRHTGCLVPVYPETTGLSSRYLRYLMQLFSPALDQIPDWLPEEIKASQHLIDLNQALNQIHFPASDKTINQAKRRLAFDELFIIQLYALWQKIKWQKEKAVKIPFDEKLIKEFVHNLPFKLTDGQRQSAWEIFQDLNQGQPMNRLLEGDVGSGKTIVAALAALQVASGGFQVAFMAPTEVLAIQHFKSVLSLFKKYDLSIGLMTNSEGQISRKGKSSKQTKKQLLDKIKGGQLKVVIGTHSLIQKTVSFNNLALVIVDEQHRFGVQQRAALQKSTINLCDGLPSSVPHLLSMTATPIPRTLALTLYGDLDLSLLKELPRGRQQIITKIVGAKDRLAAYEFIRQQAKQGRQVFVICPRIEINEDAKKENALPRKQVWSKNNSSPFFENANVLDEIKAVKQEAEKLTNKIFPEFKIAALHSKLKPIEKNKTMADFKSGKINILVSTSVVEVGVDIPNATVMMIEGAERFGLAQIHQFRGRVGRSEHQSYCFLLTTSPGQESNQRLRAILKAKNGFELAEHDLRLRGPGQFYGSKQWGLPDLSMASLTDVELIKQVRSEASNILQKDPTLKDYPLIKENLRQFKEKIHFE
ncbi:MAG: ATP-dependent DNA helicase RecG [bacterium]|nr:ATP-dependent DNA helicase RecG [bacterium]